MNSGLLLFILVVLYGTSLFISIRSLVVVDGNSSVAEKDYSLYRVENITPEGDITLIDGRVVEDADINQYAKIYKGMGTWYKGGVLFTEVTYKDAIRYFGSTLVLGLMLGVFFYKYFKSSCESSSLVRAISYLGCVLYLCVFILSVLCFCSMLV